MAQSNILISQQSENNLIKINYELLKKAGKRFKNKTELINCCIALAAESIEFMDEETILKTI